MPVSAVCRRNSSPEREALLRFGIGGLVELAFADDRAFFGRELVTALDLDLFLFALVDLGDADDMLVLADPEDRDALGVAAHDADIDHGGADHLALIGDQHQLRALARREAGDDAAVAFRRVDVGDALAAAVRAAIFIRRRTLSVAVLGDGQDELLVLGQFGHARFVERALDILALAPRRASEIGFALFLRGTDAVEDRH